MPRPVDALLQIVFLNNLSLFFYFARHIYFNQEIVLLYHIQCRLASKFFIFAIHLTLPHPIVVKLQTFFTNNISMFVHHA
jgi:hypothetical protein